MEPSQPSLSNESLDSNKPQTIEVKDGRKDHEFDTLPTLIQKVLKFNGYDRSSELDAVLKPSLKNLTHPYKIMNMEKAAGRVVQALQAKERIAVYGDFDLDGTSGASLLTEGFRMMGFENVQVYQPDRLSEGYGFHAHAVESLKAEGVSLIVTVDVGITGHNACEKAKELEVDVIITDHHQAKDTLPDAFTVVNPNQPNDESGLGYLAGTGVGYYLLMATKVAMTEAGLEVSRVDLKSLLDFFTIGTITDMVPLVKDNRILCKHGLKLLSRTPRPALRALMDELNLYGKTLTSQDLGFRFAPKLNALSRLSSPVRPIDLYLAEDSSEAELLVKTTLKENERRRKLQSEAVSISKRTLKEHEGSCLWVFSEEFHKGVIGLVATELVRWRSKCSFVGTLKEGIISGSARALDGQSVLSGLEACAKHLNQFGGHHAAAGFELNVKNAEAFGEALEQYYSQLSENETVESEGSEKELLVEVGLDEVHAASLNWLEALEPFGVGFQVPTFVARDLYVRSCRVLKEKHLKVEFSQAGMERPVGAIHFGASEELIKKFSEGVDSVSEIQFTPSWNEFAGQKSIQLMVSSIAL
ncbi:MAG: single-stranded-DNA-specific exonuclease RecJ [Bdellovibrionales bacterium]|nr:single-stranded-DNA-specific exonuclease RecJ [Bdellovibrionales bacterium]